MEDGYFDDEELINDYMEEDDMPPDQYDDAFLEEMEQGADEKDTKDNNGNDKDGVNQDSSSITKDTARPNTVTAVEQNCDLPVQTAAIPPGEIITDNDWKDMGSVSHNKEDHLYKFERYQGSSLEWRQKKQQDANTMASNQWKQQNLHSLERAKAGLLESGVIPKTSTPPEVQLVEFLGRRESKHRQKFEIGREERFFYLPVEGKDSMPMTLADGTMLHVRSNSSNSVPTLNAEETGSGSILEVPMIELLRRSDVIMRRSERRKRLRQGNTTGNEQVASNSTEGDLGINMDVDMNSGLSDSENAKDDEMDVNVAESSKEEVQKTPTKNERSHQLWVDKHAPTVFSHLLSNERTNREVLRALRAWDPYVFRQAPPPRPTIMQANIEVPSSSDQKNNSSATSTGGTNNQDATGAESLDLRPEESNRVILLSGPPGVGKTTLAHIIARHAGYRPVEVNGSDERSASVLKDRVLRAMESSTLNMPSKSKNGKDDESSLMGRPNCLILDEIDGADAKGAIMALVEIIRAEIPVKGTKSKDKKPYIRRPIIFICNHKYAPVLRPLLPYAKQFDVAAPIGNRLVARLRAVLGAERMSMMSGSSLLHQLVAGTGGDIRSCLYTLQFAAARAREIARKRNGNKRGDYVVDISQPLSSALGHNGNGSKDERNDAAGTVVAVFRKLKKKRIAQAFSSSSSTAAMDDTKASSAERVLKMVESFGDNSKTLDCLFTNLLQVSYVDPTLDRCSAAHEWLSSADTYRSHKTAIASNNSAEHHSMQRFHMPAAAAAVHLLCRVETKSDLIFSTKQLMDSRYQLEANDNLVHKFVEGLSPKARIGAARSNIVTQSIPYSLWMLSAGDGNCSLSRPVSSLEVMKGNERVAFDDHVATLRALGLTYVAVEDTSQPLYGNAPQNTHMRLEPQIDKLVQFEDLSLQGMKQRKQVPSVLKELLAHGAAIEAMREREAVAANAKRTEEGVEKEESVVLAKELETGNRMFSDRKGALDAVTKKHLKPNNTMSNPPAKKAKVEKNFLGIGAAKAKAAKTARKAALVGFVRTKKKKLSNSGSGIQFDKVIRFRYQKGFTQAVRTPVSAKDFI